jgi:hypothetical protein
MADAVIEAEKRLLTVPLETDTLCRPS